MDLMENQLFSVSQITRLIKNTLEETFPLLRIEGEISNFRPSGAGHYSFTLKDQDAVISAVLFRGRASALSFSPADGQKVIARGNLTVYAQRGNYQILCDSLELAGEGRLLALLEERKRKLAAEGLFDEERKKPLPLFPSRVAIVTSPTGAAIRDILQVLRRRNSGLHLVILPAPVQGEGAGEKLAKQIERANRFSLGEVIILGRGGGSLEDLLPFSDEVLVRAVADSRIPVISAVGHEVDWAICDYAASRRAPTPSAAAELVSAPREELLRRVRERQGEILRETERRTAEARNLMRFFSADTLDRSFRIFLQPLLLRLDDAKEDMAEGMRLLLKDLRHRTELLEREISAGSPLSILEKGYAVVRSAKTGKTITDSRKTHIGEDLSIILSKGRIDAKVEEIHP